MYTEVEEGKGANTVTSLIMKYLLDQGLPDGRKQYELTIIIDNCTSKNKNNYAIRLATYLTMENYFEIVCIIFLVDGHTKNNHWMSIVWSYQYCYLWWGFVEINHDSTSTTYSFIVETQMFYKKYLGLRDIKVVGLRENYAHSIDKKYHKEMCPIPLLDVWIKLR